MICHPLNVGAWGNMNDLVVGNYHEVEAERNLHLLHADALKGDPP